VNRILKEMVIFVQYVSFERVLWISVCYETRFIKMYVLPLIGSRVPSLKFRDYNHDAYNKKEFASIL
jgi:hypothetical protein